MFGSFVRKQRFNIPCEDVQADSLPPNIIPVPSAHVRVLARLDAHVFAGRLELPCAAQDVDALGSAVEGCGVVESLAGAEGADGVEGGECRVSGEDVCVHAVEHDAVEDLEDEIHGCGVCSAGRVGGSAGVAWMCRAALRQEREARSRARLNAGKATLLKQACVESSESRISDLARMQRIGTEGCMR